MASVIQYRVSGAWFWLVAIDSGLLMWSYPTERQARELAAAVNVRR